MGEPTNEPSAIDKAAAEHQIAEHEAATARLKLERAKAEFEAAKLLQPMAAEEAAAQETALAKLNLERATLERDRAKLDRPWWRSWNVTALGAFLAAIAPATAGVTGYFERAKQADMAQQKQEEDIRSHYLDRISDPNQTRRTLRLLAATSSDENLRTWAGKEPTFVEQDAEWIEQERKRLMDQETEDEALLRRMLLERWPSDIVKYAADLVEHDRAGRLASLQNRMKPAWPTPNALSPVPAAPTSASWAPWPTPPTSAWPMPPAKWAKPPAKPLPLAEPQ